MSGASQVHLLHMCKLYAHLPGFEASLATCSEVTSMCLVLCKPAADYKSVQSVHCLLAQLYDSLRVCEVRAAKDAAHTAAWY
jgi:hypothetical protein